MTAPSPFTPANPDFAARTRADFARQTVMATLGATLERVAAGEVDIALAFRADLCQQHGFIHAGVITTVLDSACGYSAFTLMPADAEVMTVEYKVNFLSPAAGERFLARGRVVRAGRNLSVVTGEVIATQGGRDKTVCLMQATMTAGGAKPR